MRIAAYVVQALLVLVPAYGFLESPVALAQDITGLWRDEMANTDDKTTPKKEVIGQDDFQNHFHGTYRSRPYLLITYQDPQQPEGPYFLYSDVGDLRAELQPLADPTNAFTIIDRRTRQPLGQLYVNSPACPGRQPCFTIESTTLDPLFYVRRDKLPVLYRRVGKHNPEQDPKLSQTLGDMFTPLTANFDYVLKCWDLSSMSQEDYQYTGCDANVFALPAAGSFSYKKVTLANNHTVAIPFGWTHLSRGFGNDQSRVRMLENGLDVATSDNLKIGVKASLNIMGVTADTHVNVGIQSAIDTMYDKQTSFAKGEYLSTQFALVLHKWYATLDRMFIDRVLTMRRISETQRNEEREYDRFVADFGTHYANAITFGEKGERVVSMSQKQVVAMHQSGTDVSVGLSAGYLGNSVGVDVDKASSNMQKITTNTSTDDRHWFCYSSGPCHDGIPSGGSTLPMLLDLRPITELLAPPFFNDDIILTTIRDGVSLAIAKRAYAKPKKQLTLPSAVFAQITGFQRYNAVGSPALFNPSLNTDTDTGPFHMSPIPLQQSECGAFPPCRSGTVTLQSQDESAAIILTDTDPAPSLTIPAQLTPNRYPGEVYDGVVTASISWSGQCPGMPAASWTFSKSIEIRVKSSNLSTGPTPTHPRKLFITSPNCVTADNPYGFIMVAMGTPTITAVVPASTVLGVLAESQ